MTTRDEILAEAGGDIDTALTLACSYYDASRHFMSLGLIRGNAYAKPRPPKPLAPAVTDEWIGTQENPE